LRRLREHAVTLLAVVSLCYPGVMLGAGTQEDVFFSQRSTAPCKAADVRQFLGEFVRAFNLGNRSQLTSLVSSEFSWYTIDDPLPRLRAGLYTRGDALQYFVRRHKVGEKMRVIRVRFNGNSEAFGHFEFRLVRSARDLRPTKYQGKGATRCNRTGASLAAWSMGRWTKSD
jgi:hypothetical protein